MRDAPARHEVGVVAEQGGHVLLHVPKPGMFVQANMQGTGSNILNLARRGEVGGCSSTTEHHQFRIFSNEVQKYLASAAKREPGAGDAAVADEAHAGPT